MSLPTATMPRPPERATWIGDPATTRKRERDAGSRERSLDETLAAAERAAKRAGVSRVAELTGLDRLGIPVFSAVRPSAHPGTVSVTGGRGKTPLAARISALLEAVEHHAAEPHGREGLTATVAEARARGPIVHPTALVLDARSGYAEDQPLAWWPARDLLGGGEVLVPAAAVFMPHDRAPFLFESTSNGLACGSTLPEALLHGLLEVIENDAHAFATLVRTVPMLELATVADPDSAALIERFRAAGVEVAVRVFATEIGVPFVEALTDDVDRRDPAFFVGGFAAELNPVLALRRALTEAAMSRAVIIAGNRDDLTELDEVRRFSYDERKASLAKNFGAGSTWFPFAELVDESTATTAGDLEILLGKLGEAGFEHVLAVDLTPPGSDFVVVRAIVPGTELCHVSPGRIGPRVRSCFAGPLAG